MSEQSNRIFLGAAVVAALIVVGAVLFSGGSQMDRAREGREPDVASATPAESERVDPETDTTAEADAATEEAEAENPEHRMRVALLDLETVHRQGQGANREETMAISVIVECLRQDERTAEAVKVRLLDGACGAREAATLFACLASAGTDPSQQVLLDVLASDRVSGAVKTSALIAVSQVREPVAGWDPMLIRMSESGGQHSVNALLALSAVADRVRESDPKRYAPLEKRILGVLTAADDNIALQHALLAVGNLAPRQVPKRLVEAASSEESSIRADAARALCRIEDAEAETLLFKLAGDDSVFVRQKALDALLKRLQKAAETEPAAEDRLRGLLEKVEKEDSEKSLREWARSVRESLS